MAKWQGPIVARPDRWLRSMLQALMLQTSRYTRLALATPEQRRQSARLWKRLLDGETGAGERAQQIASTISLGTRDAAVRHLRQREKENDNWPQPERRSALR